jgi:four helix bundle protein
MQNYFDHEKLIVYQEAIAFVAWWAEVSERCPGPARVKDQMDRASTSMPLNIAEGNGRPTPRDRSHFLQIARGSALECAECLDVFVARKSLSAGHVEPGKLRLRQIVAMLMGLINSVGSRVAEEGIAYSVVSSDGHLKPSPSD